MYRFVSGRTKKNLISDYLKLFKQDIDKKWERQIKECPLLATAMLPGMTPKELLVAEFTKLVDVYWYFINYTNTLSSTEVIAVCDSAKSVFTYDSYSSKIAAFLTNPKNRYEIYNCVYCDENKVSVISHKGKNVRRFDLDHVLDKGKCPLTALSLFNFVPSCETCNDPPFKGVHTIGDTQDEVKKLSPTNPSYDFEHNVRFVVNPKYPNVSAIPKLNHQREYEIDFDYKDITYKKSVELFGLKSRYNEDFLLEALRYLDLKDKYTPVYIRNLAERSGGRSYEEVYEEIYEEHFKISFDRMNHSPYRKAKEDILGIT